MPNSRSTETSSKMESNDYALRLALEAISRNKRGSEFLKNLNRTSQFSPNIERGFKINLRGLPHSLRRFVLVLQVVSLPHLPY